MQAAAYINANDVSVSKYLSLVEGTEDNVVKSLSEDFEDDRRYRDSKNAIATTWLLSFEHIRRHDPLATEYLCFYVMFGYRNDSPISPSTGIANEKSC